MGEVHADSEAQHGRAGTDSLGGSLGEGPQSQHPHDPDRRDALAACDALQDGRWLSEQHDGLPKV